MSTTNPEKAHDFDNDDTLPLDFGDSAPAHPGIIPVEEGGERPPEGATPLTPNMATETVEVPDDAADLAPAGPQDPMFPAETITTSETAPKNNRNKIIAAVAAFVTVLGVGGAVVKTFAGGSKEHQTTPTVARTTGQPVTSPTPATASAPTPTTLPSTETLAPTPTETPSATESPTPSETAPTVAPGEIASDTEDVVPLADLQKFAKANEAFKNDLIKQHPEAFGFLSKPNVDRAIGEGVLTKANLTDYLKTLKTLSAQKGFTRMFDSFNSTNPTDYRWLMSADPNTDPSAIGTICDQFAFKAIAGSKGYGENYWKLVSLDPKLRDSFKADELKQLKMGNNTDGTFTVSDFKILDAYNVAVGPKEEATVLLTYKKFLPNRSGVAVEHLDALVMTHLPAHVVNTGNGDPHPDEVTGIMFDQLDITAN